MLFSHRRSKGADGTIAPEIPKIIFNKNASNFFIFLPRTLLGRLTAAIQGSRMPSPRQIPVYVLVQLTRLEK